MRFKRVIPLTLFVCIAFFTLQTLSSFTYKTEALKQIGLTYKDFLPIMRHMENHSTDILRHIEYLSENCGSSRVTGYSGYYEATNYIYNTFKSYGISDIRFENFSLPVPYDDGATLHVTCEGHEINLSRTISAYSLLPNGIQTSFTPPEGVSGPLIYVRTGDLGSFTNWNVSGAIVLMDFESRRNWAQYGSMLGPPKAFVFVEPYSPTGKLGEFNASEFNKDEIRGQFVSYPLNMPRVFVRYNDVKDLLPFIYADSTVSFNATLKTTMKWKSVQASNILAFIEGSQLPEEVIVVSAHYDSYSVVPYLSPGADEASGVAVLLELARFFAHTQPKRSMLFVAFSGHWEALAGARQFVAEHFGETTLRLLIDLDLSTESPYFAPLHAGRFYFDGTAGRGFSDIIREMNVFLSILGGKLYGDKVTTDDFIYPGVSWSSIVYGDPLAIFDNEPFTIAGGYGLAFASVGASKRQWGTPYDTFDKVAERLYSNFYDKAFRQIATMSSFIYGFANDDRFTLPTPAYTNYNRQWGSFSTLKGQVITYNVSVGWYNPVPHALVRIRMISDKPNSFGLGIYGGTPMVGGETAGGIYSTSGSIITMADDEGYFTVVGVTPPATVGTDRLPSADFRFRVEGYVLNSTNSEVEFAPDFGTHSKDVEFAIDDPITEIKHTVFRCGSIIFYSLVEPATLSKPVLTSIEIRDAKGHMYPMFYGGTFYTFSEGYSEFIVFAQPDTPIEFILEAQEPLTGRPRLLCVLSNNNTGFKVDFGESYHVTFTPMMAALDLHRINYERLSASERHNLRSARASDFLLKAQASIDYARRMLNAKSYGSAFQSSLDAWEWERMGYVTIHELLSGVSSTMLFFFIMLIPFSFLAERLIFKAEDVKKRVLGMGGVYGVFVIIMYLLHPGFHLMPNVYLLLLSITVAVLASPTFFILLGEFSALIGVFREKIRGAHFTGISRSSAMFMAFSVGVAVMRRKRLRSILTLLTISLVVTSLVAFTFTATVTSVARVNLHVSPIYGGMLLHKASWETLPADVGIMIQRSLNVSSVISERLWLYVPPETTVIGSNESFKAYVSAVWGLGPEEDQVTGITGLIKGKWFTEEGDEYSCIVGDVAAKYLGVDLGSLDSKKWYINFSGLPKPLRVIGTVNERLLNSRIDLNGENMTPVDFTGVTFGVRRVGIYPHLPMSLVYPSAGYGHVVIIVPKKLALAQGGEIFSVGVKLPGFGPDPESQRAMYAALDEAATDLAISLGKGYRTYVKQVTLDIPTVFRYEVAPLPVFKGTEYLIVPFITASLIILNTMLTSIYERTKEIGTYSAMGLAPLHVAGMFFAESVIYAVVGGITGYAVGMFMGRMIYLLNLIPPGLYLNYTASTAVSAVILSMLATICASIYPLRKASMMVTPSVERVWKPSTKPVGDDWYIPLPFVASTHREAVGILRFVKEYFEAFTKTFKTFMVTELSVKDSVREGKKVKTLLMKMQLSPFELGVFQKVELRFLPETEERLKFELLIHRESGPTLSWKKSNIIFIDELRKQFLIWRGLRDKDKAKYESGKA